MTVQCRLHDFDDVIYDQKIRQMLIILDVPSSQIGSEPPLSCPLHIFDGEDDVKHNLKGNSL